jgi:hypothetical protein
MMLSGASTTKNMHYALPVINAAGERTCTLTHKTGTIVWFPLKNLDYLIDYEWLASQIICTHGSIGSLSS